MFITDPFPSSQGVWSEQTIDGSVLHTHPYRDRQPKTLSLIQRVQYGATNETKTKKHVFGLHETQVGFPNQDDSAFILTKKYNISFENKVFYFPPQL